MSRFLRTVLYLWRSAFIGFVYGMALAWLLALNAWVDLRLQTGRFIPWLTLLGLGLGAWTAWRPGKLRRRLGSLSARWSGGLCGRWLGGLCGRWLGNLRGRRLGWITLAVLVLVPLVAARGRWAAIAVLPAALLRETLPGFIPAATLNAYLLLALLLGVPALFFDPERYCSDATDKS